jgi:hypothetical protein
MPGFWGGACSNCIWADHTARCSSYDGNDNDGPQWRQPSPEQRRRRTPQLLTSGETGTADAPIVV